MNLNCINDVEKKIIGNYGVKLNGQIGLEHDSEANHELILYGMLVVLHH